MVHPKDRTAKCGVVYDIQCPECDQHYVGETARTLGTRIKEHLSCRQRLPAISEHKLSTGHQCSMKDIKILDHEENWLRRKIKEAINIHREKPTLNRDVGQLTIGLVYRSSNINLTRLNKIAIPNNKFQMASGQGRHWLNESPTIFSSMCSPPLSNICQFYF